MIKVPATETTDNRATGANLGRFLYQDRISSLCFDIPRLFNFKFSQHAGLEFQYFLSTAEVLGAETATLSRDRARQAQSLQNAILA